MNKVKINIGKTPFEFWFGLGFFSRLKENQGIGIEKVQEGLADNAFKLVPILMLEAANYHPAAVDTIISQAKLGPQPHWK